MFIFKMIRQFPLKCYTIGGLHSMKSFRNSLIKISYRQYHNNYLQIDIGNMKSNDKLLKFNSFLYHKRHFLETSDTTLDCWNCKKRTKLKNLFFCENCNSLQNVEVKLNYFELFSLNNQKFSIDLNELAKKFRQIQSLIHPDKFSNKNEKEQQNSSEWSSLINKAYKTLLTPISRAEYILKLKGIKLPKDNTAVDKEFLLEIMERNEEVENSDKNDLDQIRIKLDKEMEELISVLDESFRHENYDKAKNILIKIKYYKSLENNIMEKIEKYERQ